RTLRAQRERRRCGAGHGFLTSFRAKTQGRPHTVSALCGLGVLCGEPGEDLTGEGGSRASPLAARLMRASHHWLKDVVVVTVSLINAVSMPGNATTSDPPRSPSSGFSPWSKSQSTGEPVTRATQPIPSLPPPAQPFGPLSASIVTNASGVHTPACVAFSPSFKS